jgi:ribosome-associated protein
VTASDRALELAMIAAHAASEKQAENIVALDVSETLVITDIFLLCSASNDRQVKAIVDGIEAALDLIDVDPVRREGEREGRWVLLDYVDMVVHVQHSEEHSYYGLERLWKDGARIELPESVYRPSSSRDDLESVSDAGSTDISGDVEDESDEDDDTR